jgi:hypothetical protein
MGNAIYSYLYLLTLYFGWICLRGRLTFSLTKVLLLDYVAHIYYYTPTVFREIYFSTI